jgi:hypothetical protein
MRVLVACEESQAVTNRLRDRGHEAYSCDIQPASGGHPEWHLQTDVIPLLREGWDMVIAFPPCTHLAVSGSRHCEAKRKDGRQQEGVDFFLQFVKAMQWVPRVAIENPVGIMSTLYRVPDQIIQPWMFGTEAQKSTCLWLHGLPPLEPTSVVGRGKMWEFVSKSGKKKSQPQWYADALKLSPSERAKVRSKTFPGIADAMADQWGSGAGAVQLGFL